MKNSLTIFLTVVLVIIIACGIVLGVMVNSTYNKLNTTQAQLSNTQVQLSNTQAQLSNAQTQLSNTQAQLSSTQTQLSIAEDDVSSIDVVIYPEIANDDYTDNPSLSLSDGIPVINQGYEIMIYGVGFLNSENVSFTIATSNGSLQIGTTEVNNSGGIFAFQTFANWNNYDWAPQHSKYFASITAIGDKGSKAVAFVLVGTVTTF
jgi:type II secretory pathway pseudopilin PulG